MRGPAYHRLLALCAVFCGLSCEEPLPPRSNPVMVLVPGTHLSNNVVRVERDLVKSGGFVILSLRNVHDEVLSEEALVRANVTLSLREFPGSTHTLVYGQRDLVTPGLIVGNTLTLPVQHTLEIMQAWDHRMVTDKAYWQFGLLWNRRITDKGIVYWESDSVHLVVKATLQVFKRVQAVRFPPREFAIVYQLWDMAEPVLAEQTQ